MTHDLRVQVLASRCLHGSRSRSRTHSWGTALGCGAKPESCMRVFHLQGGPAKNARRRRSLVVTSSAKGKSSLRRRKAQSHACGPSHNTAGPATDPEDPERSEIRREFCYLRRPHLTTVLKPIRLSAVTPFLPSLRIMSGDSDVFPSFETTSNITHKPIPETEYAF